MYAPWISRIQCIGKVRSVSWYLSHTCICMCTCTIYAPWISRIQCIHEVPYKRKVAIMALVTYVHHVHVKCMNHGCHEYNSMPYLSQFIVILVDVHTCIYIDTVKLLLQHKSVYVLLYGAWFVYHMLVQCTVIDCLSHGW